MRNFRGAVLCEPADMEAVSDHLVPRDVEPPVPLPVIFSRYQLAADLMIRLLPVFRSALDRKLSGKFCHSRRFSRRRPLRELGLPFPELPFSRDFLYIRIDIHLVIDHKIVFIFLSLYPFHGQETHFTDPVLLRHLISVPGLLFSGSVEKHLALLSCRYLHRKVHFSAFDRCAEGLWFSLYDFHIPFLSYCQPSVPYMSIFSLSIKNVST